MEKISEKGRICRRCGVPISDRFWNPYYCWDCKRQRNTRAMVSIVCIFALGIIAAITMNLFAVAIFALIEALIIWLTFKKTKVSR